MLGLPLEVFFRCYLKIIEILGEMLCIFYTAALRGPDSFNCCVQIPTK